MNIGIIGTGWIADKMSEAVNGLDDNYIAYAVSSRSLEKAEKFAQSHGFKKAYGSYEEMVNDSSIDLVYIATPHSHHFEHAMLCIEAGRNMLIEKAFTANAAQADKIISLAEKKGLFVTEAIWTRYMPSRKLISDLIDSGIIGIPHMISANLCYPNDFMERIQKPELAGGSLLDLGVYALNFASMFFGDDIDSLSGSCVKLETGVDASESICITYKDGKLANLYSSVMTPSDRFGTIYGSKGYIQVRNINNPELIRVYDADHRLIKEIVPPAQINGYEYQVIACRDAVLKGKSECMEMPHSETIEIMKQMDTLRDLWNIRYPFE